MSGEHVGATSAKTVAPEEVMPFRVGSDLPDATRQFADGYHCVALGDVAACATREQRQCVRQSQPVRTEETAKE